jgi:hypothetical protein
MMDLMGNTPDVMSHNEVDLKDWKHLYIVLRQDFASFHQKPSKKDQNQNHNGLEVT